MSPPKTFFQRALPEKGQTRTDHDGHILMPQNDQITSSKFSQNAHREQGRIDH